MARPSALFLLAIFPFYASAACPRRAARDKLPVRDVTCSYAVQASNGDTCDSVASSWSISVSEFESLNPGVSCPTLVVGHSYCVFGTITTSTTTKQSPTPPPASPTTSPSKTTTSTSTTSAFPYQPTQSGLAANCNQFYFVQAGDTCDAIDQKYQISFSQL
ncbi:7c8f09a8-590b-48cf-ada4-da19b03e2fdc [Thermothielavioides terrestris]|uniref:7c8f09a8-590b-48cf-ada4-da19b03e2fdc n=1 Tax=Thermothielavioides terrestris TaxID=2587410 RepID=A0A3S4CYQ8_9PEZI|nr:7c8f09a8-590b-48cf-ada4-da19b03e2fdc [Thermothielavioides terrestris]